MDVVVPPLPSEEDYEDIASTPPVPDNTKIPKLNSSVLQQQQDKNVKQGNSTQRQSKQNSTLGQPQPNMVGQPQLKSSQQQQQQNLTQQQQQGSQQQNSTQQQQSSSQQQSQQQQNSTQQQQQQQNPSSKQQQNSSQQQQHSIPNQNASQQLPPSTMEVNGRSISSISAIKEAVKSAVAEMTLEEKISLGTQLDSFILQCEYAGYVCDIRLLFLYI